MRCIACILCGQTDSCNELSSFRLYDGQTGLVHLCGVLLISDIFNNSFLRNHLPWRRCMIEHVKCCVLFCRFLSLVLTNDSSCPFCTQQQPDGTLSIYCFSHTLSWASDIDRGKYSVNVCTYH